MAAGARSQGLTQAWLMLAQTAEQRGDFSAAEALAGAHDNPAARYSGSSCAALRSWHARATSSKRGGPRSAGFRC